MNKMGLLNNRFSKRVFRHTGLQNVTGKTNYEKTVVGGIRLIAMAQQGNCLQTLASHWGTGSGPAYSTLDPAPYLWPGRAVKSGPGFPRLGVQVGFPSSPSNHRSLKLIILASSFVNFSQSAITSGTYVAHLVIC